MKIKTKLKIHDMFGYIGAFFLICRLIPLIYETVKTDRQLNVFFILLEGSASLFLGIKAIQLRSYPFIIANSVSLSSIIFICIVHIIKQSRVDSSIQQHAERTRRKDVKRIDARNINKNGVEKTSIV